MTQEAQRGRWAIEVAAVGDGAVRVDVTGLIEAHERAARRWNRLRLGGAILGTLAVSGSLVAGAMALRWDVQHRRDVWALQFLLQETEARVMCWRALANRWTRTGEEVATADGGEAWVRKCVQGELRRREGGVVRRARE